MLDYIGAQMGLSFILYTICSLSYFFMYYRTGTYELSEDDTAEVGTKIIIHLKSDCANFSQEDTIKGEWVLTNMKILTELILSCFGF